MPTKPNGRGGRRQKAGGATASVPKGGGAPKTGGRKARGEDSATRGKRPTTQDWWAEQLARVGPFRGLVAEHFRFLEADYGFSPPAPGQYGMGDPRDGTVWVTYRGRAVDVRVTWAIAVAHITAWVRDNGGDRPKALRATAARRGKTVNAEAAVEYLTGGKVQPVMPPGGEPSLAEMYRRVERRSAMIRDSMGGVIAELARRVKTHLPDVLRGDTSAFAAIDAAGRRPPGGGGGTSGAAAR